MRGSERLAAAAPLALLVLALAWGGATGCDASGAVDAGRPAAGTREGMAFGALGRVEGRFETVAVGSAASGVIEAVLVKVGDEVEAGQELARIECSDVAARVAAHREQVRVAEAERAIVLRGGRRDAINAAQSRLEGAQVSLAQTRRDLQRAEGLRREQEAVSKVTEERARTQVRIAESEVRRLEEELRVVMHEPLAEDTALADARVSLAQALLSESEASLRHCSVRSPRAGTALRINAREGEHVSSVDQRPLFHISDLSSRRVRVEVDERNARQLLPDQIVLLSLDEGVSFGACGRIERTDLIMGRKGVHSRNPAEKDDRDVLEALVGDIRGAMEMPVGFRVTAIFTDRTAVVPQQACDSALAGWSGEILHHDEGV